MKRIRFSCILALPLALAIADPALAQGAAVTLQPTSDWTLVSLPDSCSLTRSFGDQDHVTWLELKRFDPWDGGFRVGLSSNQFALTKQPPHFYFVPGGRQSTYDVANYASTDDGRDWVVFPSGLWDARLDQLMEGDGAKEKMDEYFASNGPDLFKEQVTGFRIDDAFEQNLLLVTGAMRQVFDEMESCMDSMLENRGIDPDEPMGIRRKVELKNPGPIMSRLHGGLPEVIRLREKATMSTFVTYVDAKGKPTHCRFATMPFDAAYAAAGCKLIMEEARFVPALDREKKAIPAYYKFSLLYQPK